MSALFYDFLVIYYCWVVGNLKEQKNVYNELRESERPHTGKIVSAISYQSLLIIICSVAKLKSLHIGPV